MYAFHLNFTSALSSCVLDMSIKLQQPYAASLLMPTVAFELCNSGSTEYKTQKSYLLQGLLAFSQTLGNITHLEMSLTLPIIYTTYKSL